MVPTSASVPRSLSLSSLFDYGSTDFIRLTGFAPVAFHDWRSSTVSTPKLVEGIPVDFQFGASIAFRPVLALAIGYTISKMLKVH
uniref:Uncharacterized protein n=1 Tax=Lactuca sativa TaxID=4236 RepID=A0A9R1WZG5_LACSA|nr:hypothetical protein LSAT_V11C800451650 [Lactuca sativa]